MTEAAMTKSRPVPLALLMALRPRQWVKNGVLFAGIVFTLERTHLLGDWLRVLEAVAVFCLLSSAIYLVNDLCDIEQDRKHPRKCRRPLAAGEITPTMALATAVFLGLFGLAGACTLGLPFALTAALYVLLTVSYSFRLKHIVLVDVIALALCYVLRAAAGALVISVDISPWLFWMTFLGALLLGLAKRRNELVTLEQAGSHRKILEEYSVELLDQVIGIIAGGTLVAYMLYTITSPTAQRHPMLMLTGPFVIYGMLRFFYLIHRRGLGGDPSSELIEDKQLILAGLLWAFTAALVMAFGR